MALEIFLTLNIVSSPLKQSWYLSADTTALILCYQFPLRDSLRNWGSNCLLGKRNCIRILGRATNVFLFSSAVECWRARAWRCSHSRTLFLKEFPQSIYSSWIHYSPSWLCFSISPLVSCLSCIKWISTTVFSTSKNFGTSTGIAWRCSYFVMLFFNYFGIIFKKFWHQVARSYFVICYFIFFTLFECFISTTNFIECWISPTLVILRDFVLQTLSFCIQFSTNLGKMPKLSEVVDSAVNSGMMVWCW